MPKEISTYSGLNSAMYRVFSQVLVSLASDIQNSWKEHIRGQWYDKYTPSRYDRTFSYLESVTILDVKGTKGSTIKISVGADDTIMNRNHPTPSGLYDEGYGEDDGEFVLNMMEYYGMAYDPASPKRSPLESLKMIEELYEREKKNFFKKELKKYGFTDIRIY